MCFICGGILENMQPTVFCSIWQAALAIVPAMVNKKRWEKLQMQLRPSRDGYQRHFRGVGWVRGHQNPFTGGVDFHPPRSYKGWCARLCTKLFFACTLTDQNGLPGKQTLATSWWLTGRNRKAFAQKQTWEWTWRSWSDCQVKLEGKKNSADLSRWKLAEKRSAQLLA